MFQTLTDILCRFYSHVKKQTRVNFERPHNSDMSKRFKYYYPYNYKVIGNYKLYNFYQSF